MSRLMKAACPLQTVVPSTMTVTVEGADHLNGRCAAKNRPYHIASRHEAVVGAYIRFHPLEEQPGVTACKLVIALAAQVQRSGVADLVGIDVGLEQAVE